MSYNVNGLVRQIMVSGKSWASQITKRIQEGKGWILNFSMCWEGKKPQCFVKSTWIFPRLCFRMYLWGWRGICYHTDACFLLIQFQPSLAHFTLHCLWVHVHMWGRDTVKHNSLFVCSTFLLYPVVDQDMYKRFSRVWRAFRSHTNCCKDFLSFWFWVQKIMWKVE